MTEVFQQAEFWTALALFLVLFFTWKPVRDGLLPHLDQRSAAIARDIEEVQSTFDQIQRSALEAREKIRQSDREIQEILDHGKSMIDHQHRHALEQAEKDITAHRALAGKKIRQMEIRAVDSLRDHIIEQSVRKVRRRLDRQAATRRDSSWIDRSIRSLPDDLLVDDSLSIR